MWSARMWLGCGFTAWCQLLFRHRFAVDWRYGHIAVADTIGSVVNLLCGLAEYLTHGHRVRGARIARDPIFIIGHWRSGTTLLHELLGLDERHTYPTTYRCMAPCHFLLTERFFRHLFGWAIPRRRPMDNMAVSWDHPQEDEFALCMMGVPSPYLTIAFPNSPHHFSKFIDLQGLSRAELERWKARFVHFLKKLTLRDPRRLVLKSPLHTCRIPVLLELFPRARFVHIVRDPYAVFPSTVQLWSSLYRSHGLQRPRLHGLGDFVFDTYRLVHARYREGRAQIPPGQLHELRYEDLTRDPIGQMRALYEKLDLGGFDRVMPRLESYLANTADYTTNRYELKPEQVAEIGSRWGDIIRDLGYEKANLH